MKIVNLEKFRSLPAGTVFLKFNPDVFDMPCIKGVTSEYDFTVCYLMDWIECSGSEDMANKLDDCLRDSNVSVPMSFDSYGRDGMFEKKQLFAVYEKQDVEGLIGALQDCLITGYGT